MNTRLRLRSLAAAAAAASALLLTAGSATAVVVSGYLNDTANTALVASDGYNDLQAPRFANDDEIARNVAVYELEVGAGGGTVAFTSTGYANSGAQPYFTLFLGTGIGATFVDSNFFDPLIDFSLTRFLAAGSYMFTVGVWMNQSFAENNPDSDPTLGDGFTTLGVPDPLFLGNYLYELGLSSDDATFEVTPATGIITPPAAIPEPATLILVLTGLFLATRSMRNRRKDWNKTRCSEPSMS